MCIRAGRRDPREGVGLQEPGLEGSAYPEERRMEKKDCGRQRRKQPRETAARLGTD